MTANDINTAECQDRIWNYFSNNYPKICDHIREAVYDEVNIYSSKLFSRIHAAASDQYFKLRIQYSRSYGEEIKIKLNEFIRDKLRSRYKNRSKTYFCLEALEDLSLILKTDIAAITGLSSTSSHSIDEQTHQNRGLQAVYYFFEKDVEEIASGSSMLQPNISIGGRKAICIPCIMVPFLSLIVEAHIFLAPISRVEYTLSCWNDPSIFATANTKYAAYGCIEGELFEAVKNRADSIGLKGYSSFQCVSAQVEEFYKLEYRVADDQDHGRETSLNLVRSRYSDGRQMDRGLDE